MKSLLAQQHETTLRGYLDPGEAVRWSALPAPDAFAKEARGFVYFSIPWLAFIAFWTFMAQKGSGIFAAFSLPFWLVGFWMLLAPIRARKRAGKTLYAITNKRAVILETGKETTLRSFYPRDLGDLTLVERRPGHGDLIITHDVSRDSDGDKRSTKIGFFGIDDIKKVSRMLASLE
ncbi:MAG TPA: hypothetical protein VLC09_04565 [Polyangiaceae bacterium]|nr:hypothetical protein [Polyangiaceae bacterium]